MKNLYKVLAVVLLVFGCSPKSAEREAVEDAIEAVEEKQRVVEDAVGKIVDDAVGKIGVVVGSADTKVEVSEATAREWPEKFCLLEAKMTREEVQSIMGVPTDTVRDQDLNADFWEAWSYDLFVGYNIDDELEGTLSLPFERVPCDGIYAVDK